MKFQTRSFLLLLIVFIVADVFAQSEGGFDFPKKYRSVFLGFGPRTLNTDPGTIVTQYTDESPSMDQLETSIEVEDKYNSLGLQLGYMWGKYRGLSHSLLLDFSLAKNKGGLFSYSIGYNFPVKLKSVPLVLRAAVFGGFGNYGFQIGQIQNNAAYIQINDIQFFDDELDVDLSSQVFVYGPEFDIRWMMSDRFDVFANLHYTLTSENTMPKIDFSSVDGDESTSVEIDTNNPNVTYNGEKLLSLPYDIAGLRFTLGIAYVWTYEK